MRGGVFIIPIKRVFTLSLLLYPAHMWNSPNKSKFSLITCTLTRPRIRIPERFFYKSWQTSASREDDSLSAGYSQPSFSLRLSVAILFFNLSSSLSPHTHALSLSRLHLSDAQRVRAISRH